MTRTSLSKRKNLRQAISKKNRREIAFSLENSNHNLRLIRDLDQYPEIRQKIINLIISNDQHGKDLMEMMDKHPDFDFIRFLYYINAIMKNGAGKRKKFRWIIDRRRATLFILCIVIGRKKHQYCYAKTKRLMEMINDIGFEASENTIYGDLKYLDAEGLIWRNRMSKAQKYGGGSTRHIITPCNAQQYRTAWLDKINKFGTGKPQHVKDRFEAYVSNVLFCASSPNKKNIPPIYMHKCYINYPPREKKAQNREKRKAINPTEPAPEAKIPSSAPKLSNKHTKTTPPMSEWTPDCLNDPEWVTKEAVHQGCDEGLVQKLVEAMQVKQIPLKTNLLRAILHVAKSHDRGYIDAVGKITARERILFNGEDAVLPESEDVFAGKFDMSRIDELVQSRTINVDERKDEYIRYLEGTVRPLRP